LQEFGEHYAGIQFETSHAVTYRTGGCARCRRDREILRDPVTDLSV
jgi:hypothetical protein